MKNFRLYLILIFLMVCSGNALCQKIFLQDTLWRNHLLASGLSSCIANDSLDTTCPALSNITIMDCSLSGINIIEGLQYFPNLEEFYCRGNNLTYLQYMPANLKKLDCSYNNITDLDYLASIEYLNCSNNLINMQVPMSWAGNSLKYLDCSYNRIPDVAVFSTVLEEANLSYNQISSIPAFPSSLLNLNISHNWINILPSLPDSMVHLEVFANPLTSLPALPQGLEYLNASNCIINSLPALPDSLQYLSLGDNRITQIPSFPDSLKVIYIGDNLIDTLPELPAQLERLAIDLDSLRYLPQLNNSLQYLNISNTQIVNIDSLPRMLTTLMMDNTILTSLPSLPENLEALFMSNSRISILPHVPSTLGYLQAQSSDLSELDYLPDSMYNIDLSNCPLTCLPPITFVGNITVNNSNINCIPNYITNGGTINQLPLCQPSDGCVIRWNIQGSVYDDQNANCVKESLESSLENIPVRLDSAGILKQISFTNQYGTFSFRVPVGDYEVRIDTTNSSLSFTCPSNGILNVSLTPGDSLSDSLEFGVKCNQDFDLFAGGIMVFGPFIPGRQTTVYFRAGEALSIYGMKCYNDTAVVTVILQGPFSSILPSPGALTPDIISGDTIRWTVPDISVVDPWRSFSLKVIPDTTAGITDTVCYQLSVEPFADSDTTNNFISECTPVRTSFDPNNKLVFPEYADTSVYEFTYTINFQNTGNASAENIFIVDTIDMNLDPQSFELIYSSHDVVTQLLPGNILRFNYNNINLADSFTNEELSHGHIVYRVRRSEFTGSGTLIKNTAHIYFDYNLPIATNTVILEIETTVDRNDIISDDNIYIYPNPVGSDMYIKSEKGKMESVKIFDLIGHLVFEQNYDETEAIYINVTDFLPGLFIMKIKTEAGIYQEKFIKMHR
ncbi:MAG: T9SS type A sorting domain-containing protein [Bacteroidia bacterium]|nr:T9SS type A sorting domain-containing protein [Bacteroidia bacterium]